MSINDSQPTVVAAFDFDGTLTRKDTLLPFLCLGLGWPRFLSVMVRCSPWLIGFALRVVTNHVAKCRLLHLALAGRAALEVEGWTSHWLTALPSQLRSDVMVQLAGHQRAGHCCILVSASPDVYLRQVAKYLGFDALICTEMAVSDGVLTGALRAGNCHGEEKVARLKHWMAEQQLQRECMTLYAYGDTTGDKPMLRMADHAWYRGKPWSH